MARFVYRLQTLLDQKVEARDSAQLEVGRALKLLDEARALLEELRNKEVQLRDKKEQLRQGMLGGAEGGSLAVRELQNRAAYLRGLDQELENAGAEAFGQRIVVDEREEGVERARRLLADCAREVESLEKHRAKLEERHRKELEHKEALELDEAGSAAFLRNRKRDAS